MNVIPAALIDTVEHIRRFAQGNRGDTDFVVHLHVDTVAGHDAIHTAGSRGFRVLHQMAVLVETHTVHSGVETAALMRDDQCVSHRPRAGDGHATVPRHDAQSLGRDIGLDAIGVRSGSAAADDDTVLTLDGTPHQRTPGSITSIEIPRQRRRLAQRHAFAVGSTIGRDFRARRRHIQCHVGFLQTNDTSVGYDDAVVNTIRRGRTGLRFEAAVLLPQTASPGKTQRKIRAA